MLPLPLVDLDEDEVEEVEVLLQLGRLAPHVDELEERHTERVVVEHPPERLRVLRKLLLRQLHVFLVRHTVTLNGLTQRVVETHITRAVKVAGVVVVVVL